MKLLRNALASVAIVSFAVAQPAAAATRSYESLPQSGVKSIAGERIGASTVDAEGIHGPGGAALTIVLIFAALLALFAAAGLFDNGKDSTG